MGRFVKLWKSAETDELVVYNYGVELEQSGQLVISKETGEVENRRAVPGCSPEDSWFLYGMLAKLRAEKMVVDDQFPGEAHIAS
jgi:hypothetical protein